MAKQELTFDDVMTSLQANQYAPIYLLMGEEGYFIARDSVRAILRKGVRTIYNTHMHKLAADVDEMNNQNSAGKVSSLVVKSDGGKRSFRVEVAAPEGMSYARDIAQKYGVTYEMLTGE